MCVSINGLGYPDVWPFDFDTGLRIASKMGNLPSKFGHAMHLGSRIIRYVRDGRTDKQTDKSNAYCPLSYGAGYNNRLNRNCNVSVYAKLVERDCHCSPARSMWTSMIMILWQPVQVAIHRLYAYFHISAWHCILATVFYLLDFAFDFKYSLFHKRWPYSKKTTAKLQSRSEIHALVDADAIDTSPQLTSGLQRSMWRHHISNAQPPVVTI